MQWKWKKEAVGTIPNQIQKGFFYSKIRLTQFQTA